MTSTLLLGFIGTPFISAIVIPLGYARLVVTNTHVWTSRLPRLTPEASTLAVLAAFTYFVALSWFGVRRLARALRLSQRKRQLYTILLFLPGINLLAVSLFMLRARETLRGSR
jgi:hypothetical protein